MEREWRINGNGRAMEGDDDRVGRLLPVSFPSYCSSSSGQSFIEHPVCTRDTLAGVAIRYGVEVGDIKKMNGLVTDRQMFALHSLNIPQPGRHPPSTAPFPGPGQGHYSSHLMHDDDDLKRKSSHKQTSATAAMTSLQGYYGLKPFQLKLNSPTPNSVEDGSLRTCSSPMATSPFSLNRKSRSLANCLVHVPGEANSSSTSRDKSIRRRQKSEADFSHHDAPVKQENSSASRPAVQAGGSEGLGDGFAFGGVKKSSSTSDLHDGSTKCLWSDLQALSTAAITRPIFDGLPKPTSGRRNKAALD